MPPAETCVSDTDTGLLHTGLVVPKVVLTLKDYQKEKRPDTRQDICISRFSLMTNLNCSLLAYFIRYTLLFVCKFDKVNKIQCI